MKRNLTLALLCPVFGICSIVAQNRTVVGTVTSADDGQPVIGASIVVKEQQLEPSQTWTESLRWKFRKMERS